MTYAIFIYRSMGWDKSCSTCSGPYMGYTTGKGRGYQYNLPRSAARHLSHSIKIFRISDYQFSATMAAKYDEEEVAKLQEALGGAMQDGDDNDVAMTTEDDEDDDVAKISEDGDDDDAQTSEDDGDDDFPTATEENEDDDDDNAASEEDDRAMTDANLSNTLKEVMQDALEEAEDDNTKHSSSQDDSENQEDKTSKKKGQRAVSNTAEKESGE